ncbi:MAG: glycosyltransferase [Bacteroidota bacterium]
MKIDFIAWERHHFDHLRAIWSEIPNRFKGFFYIITNYDKLSDFREISALKKILVYESFDNLEVQIFNSKNPIVVSTFYKVDLLFKFCRPIFYVEHGAGQTYKESKLYNYERRNVVLDILPSQRLSEIFQVRYPFSSKIAAGSPVLDKWHKFAERPLNPLPVVALSFHFDRTSLPETRSSFGYFESALKKLAQQNRWKILGHGHPRIFNQLAPVYKKYGFEIVRDFEDVMNQADLYVCDNSSTLFEFASTNRPVVVLNAPWYRRDVEHGLRFWEHAGVGVNCNHPEELLDAIELAIADPPEQQAKRKKAVNAVYAYTDGFAATRAAKAMVDFASAWDVNPGFLYPGTSSEQIQTFLYDTVINQDAIVSRSEYHKKEIIRNISGNKPGTSLHVADLEFNFWALALFLCKFGRFAQAIKICTDFYLSFSASETLSTVFRHALLVSDQRCPTLYDTPLVSVVIPLYNQGNYISEAVGSVLNQSYPNWELIIVNDGSTDDSLEVAKQIQHDNPKRPIKILDQKNKGKGFTRNRGIRKSSGKYVCVLDADDMLATGYLLEAVDLLEKNQNTGWITPVTLQFGRVHQIFYHFDFDFRELLTVCPSPVTSIFRRELWDEVGGFDESMTDREDWEFWIKAAEAGWSSQHTKQPQFLYRIQEKRFGERSDVNINSKLEIIQRHPWWFKAYPKEKMVDFCSQFSTCNFAPEILRQENIARASSAPKVKEIRHKVVNDIKAPYAKTLENISTQGFDSKVESYLRMARHFADKGKHKQAEKYFALAASAWSESESE